MTADVAEPGSDEVVERGSDEVVEAEPDEEARPVPESGPVGPTGLVGRVLLKAIGLYRLTSPMRTPRCRYLPTCSAYAAEAIEVHGAGRGLWLAARRLARCHPFGSFGFDPVPEKKR